MGGCYAAAVLANGDAKRTNRTYVHCRRGYGQDMTDHEHPEQTIPYPGSEEQMLQDPATRCATTRAPVCSLARLRS